MKKALILFLISLTVMAKEDVSGGGNGGDIFVCPNGKSVLLDYHEAKLRNLKINLKGNTIKEKIEHVIARIKRIDMVRGSNIQIMSNRILLGIERDIENDFWVKFVDDKLADIDDSYETTIPVGCKKEQLIIQREQRLPEDAMFYISRNLWNMLDDEQKALTVLHEAWLSIMITQGAKDSRFARYMNEMFASETATINWDFYKYVNVLNRSEIYDFKLYSQAFLGFNYEEELRSVSFDVLDYNHRGNLDNGYCYNILNREDVFDLNPDSLDYKFHFDKFDKPKEQVICLSNDYQKIENLYFKFNGNGLFNVLGCPISQDKFCSQKTFNNGSIIFVKPQMEDNELTIEVDEKLNIKKFVAKNGTVIKIVSFIKNGEEVTVKNALEVLFDEDHNIIEVKK